MLESTRIYPYVYMSIEKSTGNFYIGYRWANKVPSSADLGTYYFTSNKYVRDHFADFTHSIVAEFYNKSDAYKFEALLIKETRSDKQINTFKYKKIPKIYLPKEEYIPVIKICPLPGCGKEHTNWRTYCCSVGHQKRYSAMKRYMA